MRPAALAARRRRQHGQPTRRLGGSNTRTISPLANAEKNLAAAPGCDGPWLSRRGLRAGEMNSPGAGSRARFTATGGRRSPARPRAGSGWGPAGRRARRTRERDERASRSSRAHTFWKTGRPNAQVCRGATYNVPSSSNDNFLRTSSVRLLERSKPRSLLLCQPPPPLQSVYSIYIFFFIGPFN